MGLWPLCYYDNVAMLLSLLLLSLRYYHYCLRYYHYCYVIMSLSYYHYCCYVIIIIIVTLLSLLLLRYDHYRRHYC